MLRILEYFIVRRIWMKANLSKVLIPQNYCNYNIVLMFDTLRPCDLDFLLVDCSRD